MPPTERILVVDDEEDLCEIVRYSLEKAGFIVDVAYSAEEVMKLNLSLYSLFLLDVMMGEVSGFKLAATLKKTSGAQDTPIIFLTAKDAESDKLMGFGVGADDYISKPFSVNEVVARVKAVLKRMQAVNTARAAAADAAKEIATMRGTRKEDDGGWIKFQGLSVNVNTKRVFISGREIMLTRKECDLLILFLQKPDVVLSREQLLNDVWRGESYVLDRTIDVNINRLRKKIAPYDKHIVTRQGYGYYFSTR